MYKLKVSKVGEPQPAVVVASNSQILVDHLVASAGRHGLTVSVTEPRKTGTVERNDVIVANWKICAV